MQTKQGPVPLDRTVATPPVELTDRVAAAAQPTGRRHTWWTPLWSLMLVDASVLGAAAVVTGATLPFAAGLVVASVFALRMANLYRRTVPSNVLSHTGTISVAVAAGSLVAASATATPTPDTAATAATSALFLCVGRALTYRRQRRTAMRRPQRAIVVGTGSNGQELMSRLADHPEYGIEPLGFVDNRPEPLDPNLDVDVVGELDELHTVIDSLGVQRIFLDTASVSEVELLHVLNHAARMNVEISVLPALAQHLSTSIAVEDVAGATVLSYRPSRHYGVSWAAKRVIDLVGASLMLLVSAPLWLVTATAIKLDTRGPVLYKQARVGRGGREFTIYKFRSMQIDADAKKTLYLDLNDANGPYFKIQVDPRVTRVGHTIRRFSIDELPQLLNVLKGDMSLVGPRPALASEVAEFPEWFLRRFTVRPGLSGLWQVSGRFLVPFAEATRLDVSYVDHWSLALDMQILARTPQAVLSGRGAR